jgi:putative peptidoglycan lipid II flippase
LIYLLFRHGEFTPQATELTYLSLLGYAFTIPGLAMAGMIQAGFYAMQDALTPFLCNVFALLLHVALLYLLFHIIQGPAIILAIPLSLVGSSTVEAVVQACLLFSRLRKRILLDEGMRRLLRRRLSKERAKE